MAIYILLILSVLLPVNFSPHSISLFMIVCSSYGLDDEKFENEHPPSNISDSEQVFPISVALNFLYNFKKEFFYLISDINFCGVCFMQDCTCCLWCWGGNIYRFWNYSWTQGRHIHLLWLCIVCLLVHVVCFASFLYLLFLWLFCRWSDQRLVLHLLNSFSF